ncbi:unnamed protein product [Protopolystoma xenopodis]|uniref:Uncharacterized protein n=1 Tax=Protopolystoma xenopodis TaxID=117903 RepID=A0A3S5AGC2_9PLAT|nr:unnamed protein product [Protopolystoma xenopodis]
MLAKRLGMYKVHGPTLEIFMYTLYSEEGSFLQVALTIGPSSESKVKQLPSQMMLVPGSGNIDQKVFWMRAKRVVTIGNR